MKKVLLLLPVLAISLTSCGVNYQDNKFFDNSLLKKENIPNLPKPEGKLIRAMSNYDGIIKTVYVQNKEESYGFKYAQQVFDYLRSLSFTHFYSVTKGSFLLTWSLSEREINSLEDCKYQDNIHRYYFFCSNKEADEENYIEGIGIIVNATHGYVSNKKRDFEFDCCIDINTQPPYQFRLPDPEEQDSSEPQEYSE